MRIFISWSGNESRQVAELLRDWVPRVLQAVDVYMSSQDIAKGERWLLNVSSQLSEHDFGFTVLTRTNLTAPWILYEAGALSKSLEKSRLIPILCGINEISMVNYPLSQFQYIKGNDKDQLYSALSVVNAACARPLPDGIFQSSFEKWYPDFEERYAAIDFEVQGSAPALELSDNAIASLLVQLFREVKELRSEVAHVRSVERITKALLKNETNRESWQTDMFGQLKIPELPGSPLSTLLGNAPLDPTPRAPWPDGTPDSPAD